VHRIDEQNVKTITT